MTPKATAAQPVTHLRVIIDANGTVQQIQTTKTEDNPAAGKAPAAAARKPAEELFALDAKGNLRQAMPAALSGPELDFQEPSPATPEPRIPTGSAAMPKPAAAEILIEDYPAETGDEEKESPERQSPKLNAGEQSQSKQTAHVVPPPEEVETAFSLYRIRTGDSLEISIPYELGTKRIVPVQPDGRIRYLFDVEVTAAGLTYEQLHDVLVKKLRKYYKSPRVTVIGLSFAGNAVFVMGPVTTPGSHTIQNDTRLLDVLARAGVLGQTQYQITSREGEGGRRSQEVVDLENAYIARGDRVLEVNFKKLLIDRDLSHNILLQPKDFIFIPSTYGREKKVYICGRVTTPQVYYYTGEITFLEAILVAGGTDSDNVSTGVIGADTARNRRVYIIRKQAREPIIVDYAAIRKGKKPDVPLHAGDIIYVPERRLALGSRIITKVISDIVAPLKAILDADSTVKNYYRRDYQFRRRGKARLK